MTAQQTDTVTTTRVQCGCNPFGQKHWGCPTAADLPDAPDGGYDNQALRALLAEGWTHNPAAGWRCPHCHNC